MLIPARVNKIIKDDILVWKYNMFDINMNIDEIWVDLKMSLGKYDISDSADAFNIELFWWCADFCEWKTIVMNGIDVDSKTLALIVSNLFIDALVKSSEKWAPFKVDVSLPKDKKKAFEDEVKELNKWKKQFNKEKNNIIEINWDTIMDMLKKIEGKIWNVTVSWPVTENVVASNFWQVKTNTPSTEDIDPNGHLKSSNWLKRTTLNIAM